MEWDEIHFDVRLLQRVPYEGVSRMQTSLRRKHRDRVVRRGLGMMIESDFYTTEAGRKHFNDSLTSIRYCVQETCNFDVLYVREPAWLRTQIPTPPHARMRFPCTYPASSPSSRPSPVPMRGAHKLTKTSPCPLAKNKSYLTTTNYDFAYDMTRKARPAKSVRTALNHEIMMYAVCQKEPLGLDKAVEEIRFRMSRYNVRPNMMVIPPQLALYMSLAPEAKTLYAEGGPKADAQFEAGYEGFESRNFRGLTVVTSEPFEVAEDQECIQMLTRHTQVGEHYIMKPPEPGVEVKREVKGFCDIVIYDEEGDQHVRMSWSDAVKATCADKLIPAGGAGPGVSKGNDTTMPLKEWLQYAVTWAYLNEQGYEKTGDANDMPDADWFEQFGFNAPDMGFEATNDQKSFKAWVTWVKTNPKSERIQIVLARPFIEHEMHSAVVAVAGKDTGCTLFGPSDMQIAANIQVKTIEGHYTCHIKSVVSKPQNVFVARDVCCAGYVAGGNVAYFSRKADGTYDLDTMDANLESRLGVEGAANDFHPSLFAFPSHAGHTTAQSQMDTVCSLTGRTLPWNTTNPGADGKDKFPGGEKMYDAYSSKVHFGSIHYGEDGNASRAHAFVSAGSVNNSLCFRGPHRVFNPYNQRLMNLVPGLGHFGPDAIPGVSAALARTSPAQNHGPAHTTAQPAPPPLITLPLFATGRSLAPRRVDILEGRSRGDGAGASRASGVVNVNVSCQRVCVCVCVCVCVLCAWALRRQ